jgi:hypothetical protein
MGKTGNAVRDIRFASLPELDWSPGAAASSLERVASLSFSYASAAVEWYLRRKAGKRAGARITRVCAIVLVLIASIVPLFGEIYAYDGRPGTNPLWASLALVLAAGAVGIDRFFGFSAAYMRYLSTGMNLQRIVRDFSFEWEARRARLAGAELTVPHIQESLEACRKFLANIEEVIRAETDSWIQDFTTALAEIDKSARAQTEAARNGAVDLIITNGDKFFGGWQLLVDGGSPEARSGTTAAIRGLIAGTHSITARGSIDGTTKAAERNVIVKAGSVVQLELTLV